MRPVFDPARQPVAESTQSGQTPCRRPMFAGRRRRRASEIGALLKPAKHGSGDQRRGGPDRRGLASLSASRPAWSCFMPTRPMSPSGCARRRGWYPPCRGGPAAGRARSGAGGDRNAGKGKSCDDRHDDVRATGEAAPVPAALPGLRLRCRRPGPAAVLADGGLQRTGAIVLPPPRLIGPNGQVIANPAVDGAGRAAKHPGRLSLPPRGHHEIGVQRFRRRRHHPQFRRRRCTRRGQGGAGRFPRAQLCGRRRRDGHGDDPDQRPVARADVLRCWSRRCS